MVNIVIADDNIDYATSLMNYINMHNNNIRVCNISRDGKETLKVLNSYNNIDAVLLDYKMPIYNADQLLCRINNKNKYSKSFIIISGEFEMARKLYDNDMVYSVVNKLTSNPLIMSKINELIVSKENENKEKEVHRKIVNELLYLGYDISHKGTLYLIDAINYIQSNPNKYLDNLKKEVYPIIASHSNESVHNIKCYIHRETNEMYVRCESKKLQKYFAYDEDMKPNVKTVINTIINKIA